MRRFELLPDEAVLIDEPIHWKNYIFPFFGIALAFAVLLLKVQYPDSAGLNGLAKAYLPVKAMPIITKIEAIALLAFIAMLTVKVIRISYTRYYLTDKRIISVKGVLAVQYQEMLISRCEMVYLNQSAYERIFSSGDILCVSAGTNIFLDDVHNAVRFKQVILKLLTQTRYGTQDQD